MNNLKRLDIAELRELHAVVEELRSEELVAAEKGTKICLTRMRNHLSIISKLCTKVRKELLEIRKNGKIRCV